MASLHNGTCPCDLLQGLAVGTSSFVCVDLKERLLGTRLDGQDIPSRSVFDRAALKNFKVRYLRVLLGNQHTNLEGVNYCFIHKSSLFLFSSLCGVAWISVPLKSGGTVQQISR